MEPTPSGFEDVEVSTSSTVEPVVRFETVNNNVFFDTADTKVNFVEAKPVNNISTTANIPIAPEEHAHVQVGGTPVRIAAIGTAPGETLRLEQWN